MAALGFPAREALPAASTSGAVWRERAFATAAALLPAAALVVVARRAAGALRVPLSTTDALICGLSLALASAACRTAADRSRFSSKPWIGGALRWSPTLAAFAICAALSLPGMSVGAIVALWGIVVAGELAPGFGIHLRRPLGDRLPAPHAGSALRRVRQQVTRFSDAAGRDIVEGTIVARFAAGQRTASVHLAFCPPFERAPEIACGAAGDVNAEVRATQTLAYAARFDVKLAAPSAEAIDIPVSFSARSTS